MRLLIILIVLLLLLTQTANALSATGQVSLEIINSDHVSPKPQEKIDQSAALENKYLAQEAQKEEINSITTKTSTIPTTNQPSNLLTANMIKELNTKTTNSSEQKKSILKPNQYILLLVLVVIILGLYLLYAIRRKIRK